MLSVLLNPHIPGFCFTLLAIRGISAITACFASFGTGKLDAYEIPTKVADINTIHVRTKDKNFFILITPYLYINSKEPLQ
jgi:hypothetical protein